MKCLNCQLEFTSKRADAKFCSDKCRKANGRVRDNVRDNATDKPTYYRDASLPTGIAPRTWHDDRIEWIDLTM